jgi:hypothetical protein
MTILVGIFAAAAAAAWVMAVVAAIRLARRLSGRLSLGAMAVRGMTWFDARNFQPDAAPLFRTFRLAFAGFFVCILAIAIVVTLMAGRT